MRHHRQPSPARAVLGGVAALALLVLAAGCGAKSDGEASPPTSTAPGTTTTTVPGPGPDEVDPDQVIWQVSTGGGFVPMEVSELEVPELTIYADGRVFITIQDEGDSYDDPAQLEVGKADDDGLQAFLTEADASPLFAKGGAGEADMGSPSVTDLPTTVVTLATSGPPRTVSAYAFGASFDEGLTPAQVENRQALQRLIDHARDLVDETQPWTPDRVRVKVFEAGTDAVARDDWPGPALAEFPTPTDQIPSPCLVVEGESAGALALAAKTHEGTLWKVGTEVRTFTVSPLLPGQEGCPEL